MAQTKDIIFFTRENRPEGVERIRPDGGARDVLYNMYSNLAPKEKVISGFWECHAGEILIESYPMDEVCFILDGEAVLINSRGKETTVRAGDAFLIPQGAYSHWKINKRVYKIYMIAS